MAVLSPMQFLTVLICSSLCTVVFAAKITMGGFHMNYGMTGCLNDPTRNCVDGKDGDICYTDRGLGFAITGTAPVCNACMPKNHRNIATYTHPHDLPCALWRYYQCDDLFVNHVWYKSGSNVCLLGEKSYNMNNWFNTAAENEQEFIKACRQEKTLADYRLPPTTFVINEKDFCFPLLHNITMIYPNKTMPSYQEYMEQKYNVN